MKKSFFKGVALIVMAVLAMGAFGGCTRIGDVTEVKVLSLNKYELSLARYEDFDLEAYLPTSLVGQEVTWESSDARKVSVTVDPTLSNKAKIETIAITNSPVTVTAKCGDQVAVCKVTVTEQTKERRIVISDVDGITFTGGDLNVGDTYQLRAKVYEGDSELSGVTVNWRSAEPARVTVSASGLVSAVFRASNVNVFAEIAYKGQTVTSSAAFSVISHTDSNLVMTLPTDSAASIDAFSGDVTTHGFKSGTSVFRYTTTNTEGYKSRMFPAEVFSKENNKLTSNYDKLVLKVAFASAIGLPKLRLYFGEQTTADSKYIEVELGSSSLSQSNGGAVVAFFSPETKAQITSLTANTVYALVIDLAQAPSKSDPVAFGIALMGVGSMLFGEVSACSDYVYSNKIENDVHKYGYATPSGKYTSGAYLCYSEVGGYSDVASSSDVAFETAGDFKGWNKINYRRECPVRPSGIITHTHDHIANPSCNRIMPMLPDIGKWAASLGNNGYWNYNYWGMDFALGSALVGAYDNGGNTQLGTDINFFIVSGNQLDLIEIGIDEDGYLVRCSTKKGSEFKREELDILDASGNSIIKRDSDGLYYVDIQAGVVYTIRVKIYQSLDSFGLGIYSNSAGYWYASNPYFEK